MCPDTTGVFLLKKGGRRHLVVAVDLLGRSVALDLKEEFIEPLS